MLDATRPESKPAHTPGRWQVMDDGTTVAVDEPDRFIEIATFGVVDGWHGGAREEAEANARLIAAAPQMLKALKKATSELNAIRARDGAPQHVDWCRGQPLQTSLCTEEYWDALTEECFAAIAATETDPNSPK